LLSGENEVSLVGRKAHVSAIERNGLELTGDVERLACVEVSESVIDLPPAELLIITTKAYDTQEAISACRDWVQDRTLVLTLQNGLGNLDLLRAWKGRMALGGTTTLGATLTSPGVVRVSGLGRTCIGSDLNSSAAKIVARVFNSSGIPSSTEREILREIWAKAVVSSCINPSTAILRIRNGELLKSESVMRLLDEVCAEAARVARASGVRVSTKLLQQRVREVARDTAKNTSSMLQDVERGKKTEIAQINGAICRLGERLGIDSPLNLALYSIVSSLQSAVRREKG